jgi:Divergent InlB B-repeat domain/Abnormal spindle-like microcephaly-assoc'd, ASPM-SPD-2-Hydin
MNALQPSVCAKFILLIATLLLAAGAWAPQAGAQTATQLLVPSSTFAVYPKQITGTMSPAQSIVITNSSDSVTVQISSLTFNADNPQFTETDNCVGGLQPGAACTVSIVFAPVGTDGLCIQEPDLVVNDDDPGGSLDLILFGEGAAPGGLTTTDLTSDSLSPTALAQSLVGTGVTISNVTYTGAPVAAGTFTGGQSIIGFDKGIILSDGAVSNVIGPNCDTGISTENGTPGDPDLTALICNTTDAPCDSPTTTNDAAVLEFDFVPNATLFTFQYVFASDEYPEFVFDFNDVFAFFLSQGGGAKKDIALIPGTNTIVSINNVNNGSTDPTQLNIPPVNPQFYLDNNFQFPTASPLNTEMDGLTTVLSVQAAVVPGQTYHIKLAIADALDEDLDSNVFIKAGSLSSTSLSIVPPALGFGVQNGGTTSGPQTVTITNVSTAAINNVNIAASAGFKETNTCPTSLAPNVSCTVTVTFAPTTTGPQNGTITITDSAVDSPQIITAGGTGNTGPFVTISPFSLTFPTQAIGTTSPAQTLTVTNTGTADLQFSQIVVANSNDFAETDNCTGEARIAPNGTCTISVTFTPSVTGVESADLQLSDNAQSNGIQSVGLTGNATNSITIAPPTMLAFGNQAINTTSAAQTVTLTNTGSVPVNIPSVVVGAGFADTTTCTAAPIAAGASCTVMVTFTPTSATAYSTNLTFTDSAPNSPQMIALTGTGTAGGVALTVTESGTGTGTVTSSPAGISCPSGCSANFAIGTVVTLTATPTNGSTFTGWTDENCEGTGTCTLTIQQATTVTASFAAGTSTNFILTVTEAGTGSGNVTSAPLGISCPDGCSGSFAGGTQVTLTETPSEGSVFAGWSGACSGVESCVVTVTAATSVTATFNSSNTVVTITVPSGGSTTATSTPGGTTYFGLVITCAPGQTGTVTLTATASSPLISVNFIPNTIVCPGGSEQAVQLQTFCQGTTVTQTGSLPGGFGFGGGIGMLLAGLMMGGVAFVSRRSRRFALTFALLGIAALGAGSCGSLPKSPTGQATPPGTYLISLTATLNGQSTTQPNFLTLVVK